MATYNSFLSLINGVARTVNLSTNTLSVQALQLNGSTSGTFTLQANATTSSYTITWPAAQAGGTGYVLTNDGSGNLSWTIPAGTGANTSLSNLTSTAINADLVPDGAGTRTLGSSSDYWSALWVKEILYPSAIDFRLDEGFLYNDTGSKVADFTNDILADNSGNNSINWNSRLLIDTAGATQLSWSTSGVELNQLTASTVPYLNASKVLTSSVVTPTQLGYLSGASGTTGTVNLVFSASPTFTGTLTAAAGSFSSAINMNGNQINDVGTPTLSTDAATKGYVDAAINGLTWKGPVEAYANTNVPLTGSTPLVVDGYTVQNGDMLLLAGQTTATQDGEYTAAISGGSYVLTANGLPNAVGDAWLVLNGTVFANSAFVATSAVPTATFTEFAGPTAYTFTAPLVLTGNTVTITQASGSANGYLSSTDWNTFNNKQAAGNYITALTGDGTASGPGSAAFTLATVNTNVGTFGSSTSIPSFTVNAKGLITAASGNAVIAPAGTLSGTTLNATVVSSSLTSVGTIGTGTWQGTAIAAIYGGTGQATYTTGDTLYASATNTLSKLGIGTTGQVLTVVGGVPAWAASATAGTVTTVSVASTNGFAGTVATATTTPVITISTTVTAPVLAGNGTAIVAATTTGTGSAVALSVSPAFTGTVTGVNAALTGTLVAPTIEVTAVYGGATTLTANTTYAMRWGMPDNSETAGKLYVADWSTTSFDLFWVVGLYNSTSSTATGVTITIVQKGTFTLGSSDATFSSSDQGRPVYLGSAGTFLPYSTFNSTVAAGDANAKLGMAENASTIWVDYQMMDVS